VKDDVVDVWMGLQLPRALTILRGMNFIDAYLAELDREVARSRRALENLPEDRQDWKPHDKSMAFGYLATMVATIPMWIAMIIQQDQLDVAPKDGGRREWPSPKTRTDYLAALDKAAEGARAALRGTTEEHLKTHWQLLSGGTVVSDTPRHEMLRDTINHWAHHRGQMTVYLRLLGAKVPALYGPSADDTRFA
jgi:uncharacterized damage-inducible protein DinB